jgi:hypothetical protein
MLSRCAVKDRLWCCWFWQKEGPLGAILPQQTLSYHSTSCPPCHLYCYLSPWGTLIESFAAFGSDTWCFGDDDKEKVTTLCGQLNRNTGRMLVFLFSLGGFWNGAVRHHGVFLCWILQSLDLWTYEANISFRSLKFFSTYFLPVS